MNVKKLLLAAIAAGVVMNIVDFVTHGQLLMGYYSQFSFFRKQMSMQWFVIGDFVAALVFVCVYARVLSSFEGGLKGGATFGLYAGVLVNFPTWIFSHLLIDGFTYGLAWAWTAIGIVGAVIAGAVAGVIYKK